MMNTATGAQITLNETFEILKGLTGYSGTGRLCASANGGTFAIRWLTRAWQENYWATSQSSISARVCGEPWNGTEKASDSDDRDAGFLGGRRNSEREWIANSGLPNNAVLTRSRTVWTLGTRNRVPVPVECVYDQIACRLPQSSKTAHTPASGMILRRIFCLSFGR